MIKEAGKPNKPEIYELWKSAYPTKSKAYLSYYFKHVFDEGKCLYLPQDERIIASLQMNEHIACFNDTYIFLEISSYGWNNPRIGLSNKVR